MKRWFVVGLLWASPALAQPADCDTAPVGPPVMLAPRIALQGQPGVPSGTRGSVSLDLGTVGANGTVCSNEADAPDDVLHGDPAPHGLLRGDGPADVLHNRPTGHVTIEAAPRAPPP